MFSVEDLACEQCRRVYITSEALNTHKYLNHEEGEFECTLCSVAFALRRLLKLHRLVVHGDGWKSDEGFELKGTRHDQPAKVEAECAIQVCEEDFQKAIELEANMPLESIDRKTTQSMEKADGNSFDCRFCSRRGFKLRKNLVAHVARMHGKDLPFSCDRCMDCRYDCASALHQHLTEVHKMAAIHRRAYIDHLLQGGSHMIVKSDKTLIETSEGPTLYHCSECDKRFTCERALYHHANFAHLISSVCNMLGDVMKSQGSPLKPIMAAIVENGGVMDISMAADMSENKEKQSKKSHMNAVDSDVTEMTEAANLTLDDSDIFAMSPILKLSAGVFCKDSTLDSSSNDSIPSILEDTRKLETRDELNDAVVMNSPDVASEHVAAQSPVRAEDRGQESLLGTPTLATPSTPVALQCPHCSMTCRFKTVMQSHIQRKHGDQQANAATLASSEQFNCTICSMVCTSQNSLQQHLENSHNASDVASRGLTPIRSNKRTMGENSTPEIRSMKKRRMLENNAC